MDAGPPLTEKSVVRRSTDIRVRKFRGSLLVARADSTLELDEVAEFVFKRLDGATTVRQIGELLSTEYDVSADEATADSVELLSELLACGMVTVAV
ncbi:PqqD family protein [Streptomyces sp. PKU-EA00015]|uniref:PqqD family protein n=1 Tax=Streptomyces sp. PKU-EA00015 TaxID=2748326 RepID=UPI0015A3ED77|nr:PqqD family protein [Streptomyces sp. PKU-EA00015]NWF29770.1 PqqD family protein [Streptomyces sp. PKU-EA00015]